MNMYSQNLRKAFGNQRAQCLVVDIADMSPFILNNFIKAIQNILTLASTIRGGVRVPALGLTVLKKSAIFVFDLEIISGNFHKIMVALNTLPKYYEPNLVIDIHEYKKGLHSAIDKFVKIYNFKVEKNEWNDAVKKLEVTVLTVKNAELVRTYFDRTLELVDLSNVKKITVVELKSDYTTSSVNLPGFIETFVIDGKNYRYLENFFKHWLLEQGRETEVILHFPGPNESNFSLKCCIFECIMNPLALPFGTKVYIQPDCLSVQMNRMSVAKTAPSTVPVYELNVLSRVKSVDICESSMYGLPLCLRPTESDRLNVTELRLNEEHFAESIRQLRDQDLLLLVQMRTNYAMEHFAPYFILTPGEDCLLMKSFASGDLTLPWRQDNYNTPGSDETFARIAAILNNVSMVNELDPNTLDSGLMRALSGHLKQTKHDPTLDMDDFAAANSKRAKQRPK